MRFEQIPYVSHRIINDLRQHRSGKHTGWIVQLHFCLDDLFPGSIGRPIFRN